MMSSIGRQILNSIKLQIMRLGALWAPDDELHRKAVGEFHKSSDYEVRSPVGPDDEPHREADYEFHKASDYEIRNPVDPR